jgi:putative DNA methylase
VTYRKKLIEVALPLEAINEEGSRRKRKAPAGYPTTLHKWWAQRPVAAARAVIFAQMVDDPSANPDLFPTEKAQDKERRRLFKIIESLVRWENTTNEEMLERARAEIWQSWRRACADNADHPRAKELFNRHMLPAFHDPFAGSGAIPLEAQRLGLEAFASDLNPVAVLINKAMIEIPPKFAGKPPVNPESRSQKTLLAREWKGAQGLAEDVRYYGKWMRDEAEKRIGHLYPKVEVTAEMAKERPDLKPLVGKKLTVIAWLWARTVKSPNPAFRDVDVPLASTFMLSTKAGKEAYVEPVIENGGYRFTVKVGKPKNGERAKRGTKLARGANFECVMSSTPISGDYIKAEGKAGRMGARMMAIVAEGERGRVYLAPTTEHEAAVREARPEWKPEHALPDDPRNFWTVQYGLTTYGDLFTPRQLVALTTFSDLVGEAMERVKRDALAAGLPDDPTPLRDGGIGAAAYAEAMGVYLAMAISRLADYGSSIATWRPKDNAMRSTMPKQAIQMAWDYAEGSPFGTSSSGFEECVDVVAKVMECALSAGQGKATQCGVQAVVLGRGNAAVVSTDPPYYDNVGYADLSDFFYVWLRHSLRTLFPDVFATVAVPKAEELVATPYRHGSRVEAETFFLVGMTQAMHRLAEQAHPAFPITIYYAFKQSESESDAGTASTGWETFLDAVIQAGFSISGTWPMRTEGDNRQLSLDTNALASSIVLVCRKRAIDAATATRREFVATLKSELPTALRRLQEGNIAPVDLAQAAIGPGMAVYTRYSRVLDAEGKPVPVREALALINQVLDETLAEQEGDFDADSRFAIAWFEQHGFAEGEFGVADVLARAKNTSVDGLRDAGILESRRGKVRLLQAAELPEDWDPATDRRFTHWEAVHHLIRALEAGGESAAAALVAKLGSKAETARELAYRLYTASERKKRAAEALQYNALVQSFPEITRLAREGGKSKTEQATLFEEKDR